MMKSSNVRVLIRVRPTGGTEDITIDHQQNTIEVKCAENGNSQNDAEDTYESYLSNKKPNMRFAFHKILQNSSQVEVYDCAAKDIVNEFVEGINGTIMSYGQTSSGKTFTVVGDTSNHEFRGIAPRAIAHLFVEIENRPEIEFKATCSFVEIYNEKIFDLLSSFESTSSRSDFSIVEDAGGKGTYVRGVTEVNANSEEAALNILFSGDLNRTTAEHRLNRKSNRSHSVFTIFLSQKLRSGSSSVLKLSKLNIVDLAGSERLKKTLQLADSSKVVSPQEELIQRESMYINQSLSYLEQCVVALSKRCQAYVPYRQSKLTNLLKDSMGGNGNTVVIACILGERVHMEETTSTLRLAQRMTRVQNKTFSVEVVDNEKLVVHQMQQIRLLKQELLMRDAIIERNGVNYSPFSDQEKMKLRQQVEEFLQSSDSMDDCSMLQFDSLRSVVEMIKQFKLIIIEAREGVAAAIASGDPGRLTSQIGSRPLTSFANLNDTVNDSAGVGELQRIGGISIGVAPSNSRPPALDGASPHRDNRQYLSTHDKSSVDNNQKPIRRKSQSPTRISDSETPHSRLNSPGRNADKSLDGDSSQFPSNNVFTDKETAYSYFKLNQGRQLALRLKDSSERFRDLKEKLRQVTNSVNGAKEEIDKLRREINDMKEARIVNLRSCGVSDEEIGCILDEDEYRLMKKEKEVKKSYKIAFEDYKRLNDEVHALKSARDSSKVELVEEFNKWFERESRLREKRSQLEGIGGDNEEDVELMDDQEAFDQIEIMRTIQKDPTSLAFFRAQKNQQANIKQHGKVIRRARREKRQI